MSENKSDSLSGDYAASFRELRVYQTTMELTSCIFEITKTFPREERYSLIDQVRRSSRSIGANLAEAWAKRRYQPAFIAKLSDSLGETFETQSWLDQALRCNYITPNQHHELDVHCTHIGAMLRAMENKADSFCGHS